MTDTLTGGCACGRLRYAAEIEDFDAYLCHCRMCQRAVGAISVAYKNVAKAGLGWHSEPDWYRSSPIARRPYCRECGTSLGFEYPDSDRIDLTVASFDDPSPFVPTQHFAVESMHRAWLASEGLPEMRSDEYEPLVKRWMDKVGKLPDQA